LLMNGSRYERTLPLGCGTTLEKAVSWVDVGGSSWLAPNDTLLSSSLLEELAAIMCSRRALDFTIYIYTNLMNICIINFDLFKKKIGNTSSIWETTQNFQSSKYINYIPQTLLILISFYQ
jgi:hypothetical protein